MHTGTGNLITAEQFKAMPPEERKQYINVRRDLSVKESADMRIRLYSPCGCGSGKKFKFCCHAKGGAR